MIKKLLKSLTFKAIKALKFLQTVKLSSQKRLKLSHQNFKNLNEKLGRKSKISSKIKLFQKTTKKL
jgi:hypothetical protein